MLLSVVFRFRGLNLIGGRRLRRTAGLVWVATLLSFAQEAAAQIIDPAGGILSPATSTVTLGSKPGALTLSGYVGTLIKFQADTGNGFVDMASSFDYFEMRVSTRFRAIVLAPNGLLLTSTVATVFVQDAPPQDTVAPKVARENRQAGFAPALALKVSPLAVLDPITSSILLGLEYRISPRYGLEASYGQQYSGLRLTTLGLLDGRHDYQYRKFKLEWRRYLEPRSSNPNQETYIAVQSFFTPQRYTRYGNNFYRNGRYVTYDRAFVEKDIIGLGVKVGSLWHIHTNWLLELGLGLGGRYVDTRYNMLNERKANSASESQANIFNEIESPGTRGAIDVELVFKAGYAIPLQRRR